MTISIAMATYNGEKYLREQLDSLAAQTLLPCELQIGDDGSTDRTEEIVREFAATAPFPVHFHRNAKNLGYGENFLQTAARCSGDWIAFCDQDDVWLPSRLATHAKAVAEGPGDLRLVVSDAWVADEQARPSTRTVYRWKARSHGARELPTNFYCHGFMQTFEAGLIRNFPFDRRIDGPNNPDPLPPNFSRQPHEAWICLLANATGSIVTLPEPTAMHRRHLSTVTFRPDVKEATYGMSEKQRLVYEYARTALWNRHAADRLRLLADRVAGERRAMVSAFAQRCEDEARRFDGRAALYGEPRLAKRVTLYWNMIAGGYYLGGGRLLLGSMVKDAAYMLVPAKSGSDR